MIEACARHGYQATTSRELVALAGVSKKALYQRFDSKDDCFLETYDLVVRQASRRISAAYRATLDDGNDWAAGLRRAFDAFAHELIERPGPSRLALVDVLSLGPEALDRIEEAEAIFAAMIRQSLGQAPDAVAIPAALTRPMIGGVWFVSRSRLLEGQAEDLVGCGAGLFEWMLSYRTEAALPLVRVPAGVVAANGPGCRDPRYGDERIRVIHAAAALVARGGFDALSEASIAELSGVGEERFAVWFEDLRHCFLATLEHQMAEALAGAIRASQSGPDWASGVCLSVRALFCRVAEDPAFARAAFLEPFAAGPGGLERRAALIRGLAGVLVRRVPADRRPDSLVAEAIVGSVWTLVQRQVARGHAKRLPTLAGHGAFLALAPIVGASQALEAIVSQL
jgi:AcrR family transcriptional regulator